MYDRQYIQALFQKYLEQSLTEKEKEALIQFLGIASSQEITECIGEQIQNSTTVPKKLSHLKPKTDQIFGFISERILNESLPADDKEVMIHPKTRAWRYVAAAVIGITFLFLTYHYYGGLRVENLLEASTVDSVVMPGTNSAILKLADGRVVDLSKQENGAVLYSGDVHIQIGREGEVFYEQRNEKQSSGYNEISTPRGGQYKVQLADGSLVYLNAGSKLTYPNSFEGSPRREVRLSGEAFFEVAKNNEQPFVVISADLQVKVLGTQFMMSCYPEEPQKKTTLLEGRVEVSNGNEHSILHPDEQSISRGGHLEIIPMNAREEIAWVHGEFVFNNESLEGIMKKLARWYDVEVVFEQESLKTDEFDGVISRFDNIDKVLTMLERTNKNINFKISNRRVLITKKIKI